uniref:HMG box domain-containing protein n=1 Tax=Aureoumbra lagunensis TaxID=44058 RepID=A0A7S3NJX0_9STRA
MSNFLVRYGRSRCLASSLLCNSTVRFGHISPRNNYSSVCFYGEGNILGSSACFNVKERRWLSTNDDDEELPPIAPRTSYLLFCDDYRSKRGDAKVQLSEIAQEWKKQPGDIKEKYAQEAKVLKEEYEKVKTAYYAKYPEKQKPKKPKTISARDLYKLKHEGSVKGFSRLEASEMEKFKDEAASINEQNLEEYEEALIQYKNLTVKARKAAKKK